MPRHYIRLMAQRLRDAKAEHLGVIDGSVFFVMTLQGQVIGRSRYLSKDLEVFDYDFDGPHWMYEHFVETAAASIDVMLVIDWYVDRGDFRPRKLLSDSAIIPLRVTSEPQLAILLQPLTATQGKCVFEYEVAKIPEAEDVEILMRRRRDLLADDVVVTNDALITSMTAIDGLYKPIAPGDAQPRRAMPELGYKSEDGLGRVYVSHDLAGQWSAATQLIELTACVSLVGVEISPAALRMDWCLEVLHDTALTDLDVHRDCFEAARPLIAEWSGMPWASTGKFELLAADRYTASTQLDQDYYSKVRLHCPNLGGARFLVRAIARFRGGWRRRFQGLFDMVRRQSGRGARYEVGDKTGPMTMWKRVDVEYRKMTQARDLDVSQVPTSFEPAFIQLDFAPVQSCRLSLPYLGKAPCEIDDLERKVEELTRDYAASEFQNQRQPGYFCLIGVCEFTEPPQISNAKLRLAVSEFELSPQPTRHQGIYYDKVEFVLPDKLELKHISGVHFAWRTPEGKSLSISFGLRDVYPTRGRLAGYIVPLGVIRDLDRMIVDGSDVVDNNKLLFSLTGYQQGNYWHPGGFPLHMCDADGVQMTVTLAGDYTLSGYSPPLKYKDKDYFAGRTVVATKDYSFGNWNWQKTAFTLGPNGDEDSIITMIHELCHGFGMPHECGYWDHRTPRRHTCVLNYDRLWMLDQQLRPQPGSAAKVGRHLCDFHIRALRRVRLEDNPALMHAWYGEDTGERT